MTALATAVEHADQRGLRTRARSGEYLYFQRYGLQGNRLDPQLADGTGRTRLARLGLRLERVPIPHHR